MKPILILLDVNFFVLNYLIYHLLIIIVAGGSGIHRPIKKAVSKGIENNTMVSGSVYRAKKASGDVKRKGMPDPYAYVPLSRKFLNRR